MKYLLLLLLLVPILAFSQHEQMTIEGNIYTKQQPKLVDPDRKVFDYQGQLEHLENKPPAKQDPHLVGEPVHSGPIDPADMLEFGQYDAHHNPRPERDASKGAIVFRKDFVYNTNDGSISVYRPDEAGDMCWFTAYKCDGTFEWSDEQVSWFYSNIKYDNMGEEQFKRIYCLRKEPGSCKPQE